MDSVRLSGLTWRVQSSNRGCDVDKLSDRSSVHGASKSRPSPLYGTDTSDYYDHTSAMAIVGVWVSGQTYDVGLEQLSRVASLGVALV